MLSSALGGELSGLLVDGDVEPAEAEIVHKVPVISGLARGINQMGLAVHDYGLHTDAVDRFRMQLGHLRMLLDDLLDNAEALFLTVLIQLLNALEVSDLQLFYTSARVEVVGLAEDIFLVFHEFLELVEALSLDIEPLAAEVFFIRAVEAALIMQLLSLFLIVARHDYPLVFEAGDIGLSQARGNIVKMQDIIVVVARAVAYGTSDHVKEGLYLRLTRQLLDVLHSVVHLVESRARENSQQIQFFHIYSFQQPPKDIPRLYRYHLSA